MPNDVIEYAKELYRLNPPYDEQAARAADNSAPAVIGKKYLQAGGKVKQLQSEWRRVSTEHSVAVLARALLESHPAIQQVLPIEIQDTNNVDVAATVTFYAYFGLFVVYMDETRAGFRHHTIIPLATRLIGSEPSPRRKLTPNPRYVASNWARNIPSNGDIIAKFNDSPILRCTDASIVEGASWKMGHPAFDSTWAVRRFTYTFDVASRLSATQSILESAGYIQLSNHTRPKDIKGWCRFTSMRSLAAQLLQACVPVQFVDASVPSTPFEVVELDAFNFLRPAVPQEDVVVTQPNQDLGISDGRYDDTMATERLDFTPDEVEEYMQALPHNGKASCAAHQDCPFEPVTESEFSVHHHAMVSQTWTAMSNNERMVAMKQVISNTKRWGTKQTDFQDFRFQRPERSTRDNLMFMRNVYEDYQVWAVDTEFATASGAHAIPFSLSIRDLRSGKIVLSTSVDYGNMDLDDLETTLTQRQSNQQKLPSSWMKKSSFIRFYNHTHTIGVSLSAIGRRLRAEGFTPGTHKLVSWWSTVDTDVVCRALLGNDDLIDTTPPAQLYAAAATNSGPVYCIQPFNLATLVKQCTDLKNARLGYVFRSTFPQARTLTMHVADNDTLAMVKVFHLVESVSRDWVG
ncbi:hypothetical protein N0V95_007356 [Ascochyta clinopodiicola]|nr:hypothetical protein N0V95_007356 [Ascochyta clinopodiicola]